jgi:NAD(P)-dependent dehydrogenase (short-subunit alcohol dehydrogenase family)
MYCAHPGRPAPGPPPPQVDALAAELLRQHGGVGVLVNCAASYPDPGRVDFLEGDPQAWDKALQ